MLSMFVVKAQTPGGVNNADYNWQIWLKPDSYSFTNGVWTNKITGAIGDFTQLTTWTTKAAPTVATGTNFQPAVQFRSPNSGMSINRMQSTNGINLTTGDAFTFFIVYKATNAGFTYQNILNWGPIGTYTGGYAVGYPNTYTASNNNVLAMGWPTTTIHPLGAIPWGTTVLVTVDNDNASGILQYLNGAQIATSTSSNAAVNNQIMLGSSMYDPAGNGERGVNADIQEVIMMKRPTATYPFLANVNAGTDLNKIHSYLAIKYGITLQNTTQYLNSEGVAVWDSMTNTGYDNNIFGIGRDDASSLNQVQSVSQNNNMLTIYKGTLGATNNNASTALNNKDFLMLGSNGLIGNIEYEYPLGRAFANGSITDKINYYSATVYKAQVTTDGTPGGSQTVNINVASSSARYVLVSSDLAFPTTSTRIYPISALTAINVLINDGDYVTTSGFQATPGGPQPESIIFGLWLTPDSYTNGDWTNVIGGAIGDFTQPTSWLGKTPPAVAAGSNFQPALQFRSPNSVTSLNRMQSINSLNLTANDAFTFFIVYKATNAGFTYQNILNWGPSGTYAGGNAVSYPNSYLATNSNVLAMGWPTGTIHSLGAVPWGTTALVTVDNDNTSSILQYLNGAQIATTTTTSGTATTQVMLGSSMYDPAGNGERGVNADIQEVIMLQRPKATYPFMANVDGGNDLSKIQTYLGLKYGISLNCNYMATDGTIVWDTTANTGYNNLILGIGRDDETGLYQKQSVSAAYNGTTIYLGGTLQTLNSQNTTVIPDMEYLILGSNGLTTVSPTTIPNGARYANGSINATNGINYQSNLIYKAQLTNIDTMTINMYLRSDYLYVLVSADENFDPSETEIYPINTSKVATIGIGRTYKYIRFLGYSAGPGGVNIGLKLWLHADDEGSLNIQSLPVTDPTLASYPYPVTDDQAPVVKSWSDQLRGQTYSWPTVINPTSPGSWRTPVYEPNDLTMNFHPSVRFWGSGITYGTYLANPNGIMAPSAYPFNPNGHTAYFAMSGNFSTGNAWIYQMGFAGLSTNNTTVSNIPSPGYGIQLYGSAMVGRYRSILTNGGGVDLQLTNNLSLFNIGATSINGYYQLPPITATTNHNFSTIFFRFNGRSDTTTTNPADVGSDLSQPSTIGSSYTLDRTVQGVISEAIIFDHALAINEQRQVESYLAIKYGVTLRPSNTTTNRFNYTLSDGTEFWQGDVDPSDPILGKYATFYNNVAAVIRDDAAKLDNQQSHSTDAGSLLHMGVAGTKLGSNANLSDLSNDLEAVSWGSDSGEGVTAVATSQCADFQNIFNKRWLVHKLTKNDRPIAMLVGAEDNSQNNLGSAVSAGVMAMYTALGESNDVSMIVADSPNKLTPGDPAYGDFLAVVPMRYVDGEQQCIYTFTDSIVYVTFGYKPNTRGCYGVQFDGSKTYAWNTQWPRANYSITGVGARTIAQPQVDLGDSVTVNAQVTYDNAVRSDAYYPSFTSNPRNALVIQRRYGTVGVSKVTITLTFGTPVVPSFSISGLDSRVLQNDQVTITGSCPGGSAMPTLMYAGNAKSATYTIQGNRATVTKSIAVSDADKNGTVNVLFRGGVTTLTIEYVVNSRIAPGSLPQTILISPITLTRVLPPPVISEDGLSFTKMPSSRYITTCDPMEYTFRIGNVNDVDKYVNFEDVLPDSMTWVAESVSFDSINTSNPGIKFNEYGGTKTLTIDSLLVPCTSEIIFKATAAMAADAPTDVYANRAVMHYQQMINDMLESQDAQTLDSMTVFNASWAERQDTVLLATIVQPPTYSANNVITVTLKVTNPNTMTYTDMFLNLNWDAGFTYVPGSWNNAEGSAVVTDASDTTVMLIAGASDSTGFILPNGETEFSFQLLAPTNDNLQYTTDDAGNPTAKKALVNVSYSFSTEMDDPCIIQSMDQLMGILQILYKSGKSFIIVNEHITTNVVN